MLRILRLTQPWPKVLPSTGRGAKKNFALGGSGLWLENLKVLWPHNAGLVWFDFICPEKWISRGDVPSQDVKIRASSDVLKHGIYKASH